MNGTDKVVVMRGDLKEFDLANILQVASIGRQYTAVELCGADGRAVGAIFIKSGKVVSAFAPGVEGKEAFFTLFERPLPHFHVFRTETPPAMPEPIGSVSHLLMEAFGRLDAPSNGVRASVAPDANLALHWSSPPFEGNTGKYSAGVQPRLSDLPQAPTAEVEPPPAAARAAWAAAQPPAVQPAPPPHEVRAAAPPPAIQAAVAAAPPSAAVSQPSAVRAAAPQPAAARAPAHQPAPVAAEPRAALARAPAAIAPTPDTTERVILAVASPKGGAGKTTVSLNLALSLARQGRSVVLIDTDVNGDILSAIDSRDRAKNGTFDVIGGRASLDDSLLATVIPDFKILPARGQAPIDPSLTVTDQSESWRSLLRAASARAQIVVVDTPAGMWGVTHQVLSASTHVIGVLQSEVLARRSFAMFAESIEAIPVEARPRVLGVFLNMLQVSHTASVSVMRDMCGELPKEWLFDTAIPRSPAFLDANQLGVPLRLMDEESPPAVTWLFDSLATEVVERLKLPTAERRQRRLLV